MPEDDDAVDVVYETVSPKDANFMVYNVDDSDMASDAENQPPAESTPLTSPSNEGKAAEESESANGPKGSQSSRSSPEVVNGSQKSPIIIDVEVPPVASDIAPSDAPANPEKSNITYPDPFGSLEDPYNEKGSVSERLSVDAGDDDDGDDVDIRDWDEYDKSDSEEDSSSQLSAEASDLGSGARELIYAALSYKPPYVESGDLEDVGIPSKLMRESDSDCPSLAVEKPEASMLGKTTSNVHSGFQPEIPEQASSRQFPGLYWTSPKPNTHLAPHSNSNERCCDPGFPPTTSVSSYSPMGTNQVNHPQPSYAPGDSCTTGYYTHAVPQLPLREDAEKSKPLGESPSVQGNSKPGPSNPSAKRVSVSDVVEQSSGVKQPSQQPLKRKAHEMESDSFQSELAEIESYLGQSAGVNTSMGRDSDNEESFSQDAQPRTSDSGAKCSASQLRELPPIDAHSSGQEPPRKRVNTGQRSRMGGLAAHATTALVGAMLGGLGTIVALASLPPEYFQ